MPGIPPKGPMSAAGVGASNRVLIDEHEQSMRQKLGSKKERQEEQQQMRIRELRQQRQKRVEQAEQSRQRAVQERTRRQLRMEAVQGKGSLLDTTA